MPDTLICPCCGGNRTVENDGGSCRCPLCRTTFRRSDEECLASSLRSITLDLKRLGEDRIRILISSKKDEGGAVFKVFTQESQTGGAVSASAWTHIASTLFSSAHFECWKQTSYDPSLSDGMTWTLTVTFERKHAMSCHGCNGYPPYWNDVISSLAFCFRAADLDCESYLSKKKEPS